VTNAARVAGRTGGTESFLTAKRSLSTFPTMQTNCSEAQSGSRSAHAPTLELTTAQRTNARTFPQSRDHELLRVPSPNLSLFEERRDWGHAVCRSQANTRQQRQSKARTKPEKSSLIKAWAQNSLIARLCSSFARRACGLHRSSTGAAEPRICTINTPAKFTAVGLVIQLYISRKKPSIIFEN
jgi:hypothetical protein